MNYSGQKLNNNMTIKARGLMFLVLVALFTFPSLAQRTVTVKDGDVIVHNSKYKNKVRTHSRSRGLNNFDIEYRGDIEVTDDDRDIKSISAGGYLEITKTTFGNRRSILIESAGGRLIREYKEGRREVDYEPEGRKWLAEILPDIVRSSSIAAESRVNRYFKQGGVDAVLNEISRLDGSYVQATYAKILLRKPNLSQGDLIAALKGIADEINSDYYLAQALKDNSSVFLKNEATAEAYFEAVKEVGSDYYAASILKSALDDHDPSSKSIEKIMEASKDIGSDYYQAAVLSDVLEIRDLDGEAMADIIATSKDIGSDYYQSQILSKAMGTKGLTAESYETLMEAVSDVSSDYYMASVFSKLLENELDDKVRVKMIMLIDDKMSSDYYAASIYTKMLEDQELTSASLEQLADALEDMSSAHYASSVIKKAADSKPLSKETLKSLIKAASELNSDYYKSSALEKIAPQVNKSNDKELKEAYRKAAQDIRSDTYYGRAMRALDRD